MTTELQPAEPDTVTLSAETVRVLILGESVLPQPVSSDAPEHSFDPYNTGITGLTLDRKPRKSLDDMRRRPRPKGAA